MMLYLRNNLSLCVGLVLSAIIGTGAVVALVWTPFDPLALDVINRLSPPSLAHPFGTDEFGRDVVSRIMRGASTSISIALMTVAFAVVTGTAIGLVCGFFRGWADRFFMMLTDALLAFPAMLLALGLVAVIGASRHGLVLALGLAYLPKVARIARSSVLSLREREYVEASRALGNGVAFTIARHVLPNALTPIAVLATSMFGWIILVESALSYLGLGVPPPAPTWGNMLSSAQPFVAVAPWLGLFPGIFITAVLLAVNLLGDALRDWLDPRMQAR